MKYWLCITTRENWEIIKNKKIWGVPQRHMNIIKKVREGDKLVFYVKQERKDKAILEPKIVGIYEAIGEAYKDNKKIFKSSSGSNEVYPWRIRIREVIIGELDFKSLIPKLSFIKNKKRWSGHLMGRAMVEIPEKDYELILKTLE